MTWASADVKDQLRRRHPGKTIGSMTGQWTCIEEWADIDLLAINAWKDADVIGYEVKISRSDYRAEIRQPRKREEAVAMCTEFYFAVPAGLLKPDEIAYEEPEWEPEDWERSRCPGIPQFGPLDEVAARWASQSNLLDQPPRRYGGQCHGKGWTGTYKAGTREKGPFTLRLPVPWGETKSPDWLIREPRDYEIARHGSAEAVLLDRIRGWVAECVDSKERAVPCPACSGKGYIAKSRVEAEAPTLWVPRDVGLIEVSGGGCRVVKRSPKRRDAPGLLSVAGARDVRSGRQQLAHLVRWVSNRPDPRHLRAEMRNAA